MFASSSYYNPNELPTLGTSPTMNTPYLDSSIDTPFLDNHSSADTPPFFDTLTDVSPYLMYASFGLANLNMYLNKEDDICARYLEHHENDISKLTHDPLKFNGDPNLLLLDKSKASVPTHTVTKPSPTLKLETVTEENSDSLFPPLNSSQQSINTDVKYEDLSMDELLGFDASSPLSEDMGSEYEEEEDQKQEKPKEPKLHYCPLCDHVSKRRYNLDTHIKTHDKNRIKEFGCPQCHKAFDRRHDRDRHLATVHRGERSYACSHCATHFSRRDALNRHLVQKHEYDENDFIE
ncbi:uncharacterized protein B0P05DRAFT_503977 [Gilbertella persicaria]|uniref:uncharacterized protein n=1 Tax=Gilbertella persicaria TaxID=101096 RepID=UPI00221F8352|nr:uncharacterized protein B0P05DRAFT_503977 [Gilbertella persicaria]KAI8091309.1 hypothetical protein B0P05DRAFT_503977 [Gilbertella persicaria]